MSNGFRVTRDNEDRPEVRKVWPLLVLAGMICLTCAVCAISSVVLSIALIEK